VTPRTREAFLRPAIAPTSGSRTRSAPARHRSGSPAVGLVRDQPGLVPRRRRGLRRGCVAAAAVPAGDLTTAEPRPGATDCCMRRPAWSARSTQHVSSASPGPAHGRSTLRCLEHRPDLALTVSSGLTRPTPTTQSSGLGNRRLGRDSPPHAVPHHSNGGENDQWLDREVELPITRMIKVRKRSIGAESIRLIHSGGDRRGFPVRTARWA
jgi:hypothetical protein